MNKMKKALFVFFVGVGVSFGIAGSASALVPCEACYAWLEECQNGDQTACNNYYKPIHRCSGC
ncbi:MULTISPECIES: hypothetical protein [Undibacterium]|jgi:hypothetical protein|uniref:Lipoprotein n=1 Tax=Undibacterium umbellatum TaxID=2762300 RepID=A0ABR6Z9Y7_9BURK|nr:MULTISPECIES: hypothetical protein [Undibacterium]MBC3908570.1 hypothetical protein [Undibacterium umbellatum]MDP1976662.1 hypothetical protein [Undibacterium sp.]